MFSVTSQTGQVTERAMTYSLPQIERHSFLGCREGRVKGQATLPQLPGSQASHLSRAQCLGYQAAGSRPQPVGVRTTLPGQENALGPPP